MAQNRKRRPSGIRHQSYGRYLGRRSVGAAPGTLQKTATTDEREGIIRVLHYDDSNMAPHLETRTLPLGGVPEEGVLWLQISGLPSTEQFRMLQEHFDLDPLALEDIVQYAGRPKVDIYDTGPFAMFSHFERDAEDTLTETLVALFLGRNWVISITDRDDSLFDPVRKRLLGKGAFHRHDASYLFYALIDVIVDSCFPVLDAFGDRLEHLEDLVLDQPDTGVRSDLHYARRELLQLRRAWWPQRDVVAALMRDGEDFLSDTTRRYLHDCHDHCVVVMDFIETYRETTSGLMDTYLASMSQHMNDIMKILTIIATIFMPLAFVTGIYGMNFDTKYPWNMPELGWEYGYAYSLAVMAAAAIGMVLFFRRKGWL